MCLLVSLLAISGCATHELERNFYLQEEIDNNFTPAYWVKGLYAFQGKDTLHGIAWFNSISMAKSEVMTRCVDQDSLAYRISDSLNRWPCEYVSLEKDGRLRMELSDRSNVSYAIPHRRAKVFLDSLRALFRLSDGEWEDAVGNAWDSPVLGRSVLPHGSREKTSALHFATMLYDQHFFATKYRNCIYHITEVDLKQKMMKLKRLTCQDEEGEDLRWLRAVDRRL